MSVTIQISKAVKRFGNTTIIPDLSLTIEKGEFFTLLGPSGCGKTTLLRMIAGFNSIEGGDFYFNDKRINDMEPDKRNIGMVFQNYAIFPHMSVRRNVEFGLKNKRFDKEEIKARTDNFLKLMQIDEYAERMPDRLSGGQQQRVALARALAIRPDVLLMDEPLSNLDAKLRVDMRTVIKEIQHTVGITTVYVTHDQEEAMAISDRIAVMKSGVIQQLGTPKELYQRPANQFVASFIGRTNFMTGTMKVNAQNRVSITVYGYEMEFSNIHPDYQKEQEVLLAIRPEEFVVFPEKLENGICAKVIDSVFLGLNTHYFVELSDGTRAEIIQESTIDSIISPGTEISLAAKTEKVNVLSCDGAVNYISDNY